MPHVRILVRAVFTLVLLGSFAHADTKADKAEAAKRYELGKRHYNLNEWDEAIAEFKAAYKLSPDPVNLYNIAQAYRLKGKGFCTEAAQFYANYQREEKAKKLRDSVAKVRKDMEECAKTEKPNEPLPIPPPVPAPSNAPPPPSPAPINPGTAPPAPMTSTTGENALRGNEPANLDPNRNRRMLSYVLIGVGSLSVLTGISFSFKQAAAQRDLDECDEFGDCGIVETRKLEDQRDSAQRGAAGSYGFGGVCALGGVILYMVSRKPKVDAHKVTVLPTRHGAALGWTF